jgi:hypothetical protein
MSYCPSSCYGDVLRRPFRCSLSHIGGRQKEGWAEFLFRPSLGEIWFQNRKLVQNACSFPERCIYLILPAFDRELRFTMSAASHLLSFPLFPCGQAQGFSTVRGSLTICPASASPAVDGAGTRWITDAFFPQGLAQ